MKLLIPRLKFPGGPFKGKKGQAIVETAIALPFFLFLLVTLVDGARIMNLVLNLSRLTSCGVAYATGIGPNFTTPDSKEIKAFVLKKVVPPLNPGNFNENSIVIDPRKSDSTGIPSVHIRIRYPLGLSSPFLTPIFGKTFVGEMAAALPYFEY